MTPHKWCEGIERFKAVWHCIRPLIAECPVDLAPVDDYLKQITADHLPVKIADQLTPEYLNKSFQNDLLLGAFDWSATGHGRMWSDLRHAKIKWEAQPTYSIDLSEVA